nr:aminotransferase class III-fold pyridoxal phosphate-dependent enzyme [Chloroflexota bacterium]
MTCDIAFLHPLLVRVVVDSPSIVVDVGNVNKGVQPCWADEAVDKHGSTQGGNPLACAAGVATMRALRDEGLIDRAAEIGAYFMKGLQELAARGLPVTEVRGRGLMLAVEIDGDAPAVVTRAREGGVLLNATGPT